MAEKMYTFDRPADIRFMSFFIFLSLSTFWTCFLSCATSFLEKLDKQVRQMKSLKIPEMPKKQKPAKKTIDRKADSALIEKINNQIQQMKSVKIPPPLPKRKPTEKKPISREQLNEKFDDLFYLTEKALGSDHFDAMLDLNGVDKDLSEMFEFALNQEPQDKKKGFEERFKKFAKIFTKWKIDEMSSLQEVEEKLPKIFNVHKYVKPKIDPYTIDYVNRLLDEHLRENESDWD